MSVVPQAVAALAAESIRSQFASHDRKQLVRVRGFLREEISSLVSELRGDSSFLAEIIVIAKQSWDGIPDECILPADSSATRFRNDTGSSYVFIEFEEFSDRSGMAHAYLVSDGNLLGQHHLEEETALRCLSHVWRLVFNDRAPAAVVEGVKEVVAVYRDEGVTIALRIWTQFLAAVAQVLNSEQHIDPPNARSAIANALPSLGLFPDAVLVATAGPIPRQRRLRENLLASMDRTGTGKEIDRESLSASLAGVQFLGFDGVVLSETEQAKIRPILERYLAPHGRATTAGLEFHYWRQLFQDRSQRRGLGVKIREELELVGGDALDVFEELEIEDGLTGRDASSAQELIDSELDSGAPLYRALSSGLQRRIEKLANPRAPATDQPLRDLVRLLRDLASEEEGDFIAVLEPRIRHGAAAKDRFSKGLFAFLFGPTLEGVSQRVGSRLAVDPALLDATPLRDWLSGLDDPQGDDEEPEELEWEPLEIQVRLSEDTSPVGILEWDPRAHGGLIALARIVYTEGTCGWSVPAADFEDWSEKSIDSADLPGGIDPPGSDIAAEWYGLRQEFLRLIQGQGFATDLISEYCSSWASLLDRAHSDHVPTGAFDPAITEFLRIDVYDGPPGSKVLLGTHPIRLRWIAEDLNRSADLIVAALKRSLRLNSVNEEFFFDRLAQSSAHEQPAILCDASSVMVAVRESDWHEHFQRIKTREKTVTDWLGSTDDSSLDEIAKVLGRYADAFPFKNDGLHVLFVVRRGGSRIVHRTLGRFKRQIGVIGRRAETRLAIHVVCPSSDFDAVARVVEDLDGSLRAGADFPTTRLILHEWEDPSVYPDLSGLTKEIDVAVVPNLFAAQTRCQEASCSMDDLKGEFRPWIDRCTTRDGLERVSSSASVSVRLLPEARDEVLSKWSTINVRHFRGSKVVSEGAGQEVDYITLSVAVSEAATFFEELHAKAHWVITLDPFVGRRQLESFEHRPEVITVKPGLGTGGGYTMIVSSQVGRDFIQGRLARRLELQLGNRLLGESKRIAEQIYQRARDLSPGLLLRATGLGRTAQEAVGLVASQSLADQFVGPELGDTSFVSWIALDERPEWFGRGQLGRADLLRVSGLEVDGDLVLSFMVVEAKLRDESSLTKAVHQLDDSCQLVADAFTPISEDFLYDAEFWWSSLLEAIEESARETDLEASVTFRAYVNGTPKRSLLPEWSAKIREGQFLVDSVKGTVCTFSEQGRPRSEVLQNSTHYWIQVTPDEMADVLGGLDDPGVSSPLDERATPIGDVPADVSEDPTVEDVSEVSDSVVLNDPTGAAVSPPRQGEDDAQLGRRYQKFLDTFVEHHVEVVRDEESPIREGPGFFVFRVKPGTGVSPSRVQAQVENLKLKMELPADLNPRAFVDRGSVVFEVPKQPHERFYVAADELWDRVHTWPDDRLWVSIGEDIEGKAIAIDFSSNETPHLLIGGMTGAGKSVALETIITGLLRNYSPEQLKISAVDPKNTELTFLEGDPHLDGEMGWDAEDAKLLLGSAVDEMQARYARMRSQKVRKLTEYNAIDGVDPLPWRLVVLDEFADLTSDRDDKREIEHSLQRLAQKARACGIHVIVATQKPSAEVLSTKVRSNLGAQLALRVKNATDSRVIMDSSGAEALAGGGDAFLRTAAGGMVRFQCAMV